jgi:hypothetical protein
MDDKNLGQKEAPIAVGLHGLAEQLGLKVPLPVVRSEVVPGARKTTLSDNKILQQYPKSYLPTGLMGNLRFTMRYEPIDLGVLNAAYSALDIRELEEWIRSEPTGLFARRAWYLYELLSQKTLDVPDVAPSGYVDLLDEDLHVTGSVVRSRRQRVNDNLLGNPFYSL